ncbi:MAG: L,D-transpeptidase family protein [Gammaproteobacteria bacterium]
MVSMSRVVLLLGCLANAVSEAAVFPLPAPGNDLVGEVVMVTVQSGDTLLDIARRHDLGYKEIVAANPDVDPWLPPVGGPVLVPTRFILPNTPREGIVINLAEMRLYYFPARQQNGQGVVMTFPIGIGQEGWSTPLGKTRVIAKKRNPAWTVPESIRRESVVQGDPLPAVVPPGPDNPLGQYAMRLGIPGYLIHGTNKPFGVGRRISHGCIRMYPEDIEVLFGEVSLGTTVRIVDQPYKVGRENGNLYLEAHEPITDQNAPQADNLPRAIQAITAVIPFPQREQVRTRAMAVAGRHSGIPHQVATIGDARQSRQEGWMLQVGAFSSMENAMRMVAAVAWLEMPVAVEARVNDGFCHVLVGPFPIQEAAEEALLKLAVQGGVEAHIFPADRHGGLSACLP